MESFQYYKRGEGELNTSNFPAIVKQGRIVIDNLDCKTFFALSCLNQYI